VEAMKAMFDIMNNMPESESAFEIAKESILNKIESERITKSSVLFDYEDAKRLNLDHDIRKDIYETVKNMTMEDLMAFHTKYIKDKDYVTVMIGNRERIDFNDLKKYGKIEELSLEEIFGYEDIQPVNVEVQQ
jgi:zinc protease